MYRQHLIRMSEKKALHSYSMLSICQIDSQVTCIWISE